MKIALLGYGKMGKEIEKIAIKRNHTIALTIDNELDWANKGNQLKNCDVAIDFSMPICALDNIAKCFKANTPLVMGTTSWHDQIDRIRTQCIQENQAMIYGSNFSIGVNIFFAINKQLAKLMNEYPSYIPTIEEIHHTTKLDAPSGTAISIANDIIAQLALKNKWINTETSVSEELPIISKRIENVPGTHIIQYENDIDSIEIKHIAKNRIGFAEGAVLAAEWLQTKKGFFEVKDWLNI